MISLPNKLYGNLGLIILSALLFAAMFPNPLVARGVPFLAWIAYIPVFFLLTRVSLGAAPVWGALYGCASYGLFNYWLTSFHPLAGVLVYSIYMIFMAALFFALKLAIIVFPRRGYLVQWLVWLAYEYLRTLGFLGYPYGITGYSQWQNIPLIQIADIFGVWGISALVVFPSVWLGAALAHSSRKDAGVYRKISRTNPAQKAFVLEKAQRHKGHREEERGKIRGQGSGNREQGTGGRGTGDRREKAKQLLDKGSRSPIPLRASVRNNFEKVFLQTLVCEILAKISSFFRKEKLSAIVWGGCLVGALVYGFSSPLDFSSLPHANIALIQHNNDPWIGGLAQYRENFNTLRRLSDEALAADPGPDLVVWSETAFVPRIYWHQTYRDDQDSWLLVRELLDYLALQDVPFVIGNDDARMDPAINPNAQERFRVDYNAAMLFENGVNTAFYRKIHLVPFTEHFPYARQFPRINRALLNANTHFWEKGREAVVFSGPGFTFSTPICFEDSFGYLSRMFVRNGAEIIVNLSNDAWSDSLSAQYQHLSMAVFRAVENRRSMVRSTSTGQTCGIAPNGRIIAMAEPFTETWLTVAVPVVTGYHTTYTRRGDFLAAGFTIVAFILLILGCILCIMAKTVRRR